jgi:general secretion pathway protein E
MYSPLPLGEVLIRQSAIKREDLDKALAAQAASVEEPRPRIGELLIKAGVLNESGLGQGLAAQFGVDYIDTFDVEKVNLELSRRLPYGFATQHLVMPLERMGRHAVVVICADPLDTEGLDLVRLQTGAEPVPLIGPRKAVHDLITAVYARRGDLENLVDNLDASEKTVTDLEGEAEKIEDILSRSGSDDEGPIIQFVNTVFQQSVRDRASDIHIEPMEDRVAVRFRVDGLLSEVVKAPKRFQNSIAVRIKIMANLNIAEKRVPQDGRIRFRIAGRDIDVRVATAPASHGERITMRLLDRNAVLKDLPDLGLAPRNHSILLQAIHQPHGIVLVTGPTGSGKTTTLYACLNHINTPDKNILTVEDPVEYQLPGISQMQVNPKIELTFASGLRSYLRHDPDVVMVGEIRDSETASIAIQASLTGHLVFSTLHTNDAAGAFSRLIDMGIEPFLVSSSLTLSLAQRLVRRLCQFCKRPYVPSDLELKQLGFSREALGPVGGHLYQPTGCSECNNKGYSGRTAIYEMLEITNEIRHLVMDRKDAGTIRAKAIEQGMSSMRQDGAQKVLNGFTSIPEVLRVTVEG